MIMRMLFAIAIMSGLAAPSLAQSFADATRTPYQPAPTKSINGKSIAEMKAAVEKEWDNIKFEDASGAPIRHQVVLQTDAGDVEIDFFPKLAPSHARSFIGLAKAGFFDGLIFHRCIPGFVIQGGCPKGTGTGGPGYCLNPEFNATPHLRGILSMARAQPKDSAGSQFFICVDEAAALNSQYTAFGQVSSGMEVVDAIVKRPTGQGDRPIQPVTIKKAIVRVAPAQ